MEQVLEVIFALMLGQGIIYAVRWGLRRAKKIRPLDEGRRFLIFRLLRTVVYVITFFIVIEILGFNLTVIWAGSAALLVGVGIGLQGFFNDVISGFVLLFEGGIRVGDELEVEGVLVKVKNIALRATSVETVSGDLVVMPNSKIAGNSVRNLTQGLSSTRISIGVGVAYGSDIELVSKLLLHVARSQKEIVLNPVPQVIFSDFGESSLDFEVRAWIRSPWERRRIESDIRFGIDKAFRKNNITIPFPQRDVHLHKFVDPDISQMKV